MNDLLNIENKIVVIRGQQVMLDRDLAELYGVETKRLKEQVRRNIERFLEQFCFQLTDDEFLNWRSQIATSNSDKMGLRYAPYAFTEQGVAMLSAVLHSSVAIKMSISIMNAFVHMRHHLNVHVNLTNQLNTLETKVDLKFLEYDKAFTKVFKALDSYPKAVKEGIFIKGQIFDAYSTFQSLIQKADKEIILIDNYINITVLDQFAKKSPNVKVVIYTRPNTQVTQLDIDKFNEQYPALSIKHTDTMHDRFLIIDNTEIYHIGASIKDLGKKCFGLTQLEDVRWIKTVLQAL